MRRSTLTAQLLPNVVTFFLACISLSTEPVNPARAANGAANPEAFMHPISMITYYGYPAELHQVVTADGHLLEIHRMPGHRGNLSVPVILQHGIASSSADFVANKPPNNLACLLWDHGYDVWMSNTRGNRYSAYHTKYDPEDPRVWDFSVDEMAKFDLPAVFSHVKRSSGFARVHYIGHSQGTQSLFALLSTQPEFGHNIRLFTAMAPVTAVQHVTTPFIRIRRMYPLIRMMSRNGHVKAWNPRLSPKLARLCQRSQMSQHVCSYNTDLIYRPNRKQQDRSRADVYFSHYPMDTSVKNGDHLLQLVDSGGFAMFDYGPEGNLKKYGVPYAPKYPLQRIRDVRIALMFAQNDNLVELQDAKFLMRNLRKDVLYDVYTVPKDPDFTHVDFLWGTRAREVVWNRILRNMIDVDHVESAVTVFVDEFASSSSEGFNHVR